MTDHPLLPTPRTDGAGFDIWAKSPCFVLRNPKVAAEISRRQQALAERNEITAGRVIEELAKLAFSNLGDFYKVNAEGNLELDLEALADPKRAAAVAQIDITEKVNGSRVTKIRLADKRAALVDLGRHLGLFESEAPQAVPVDAPSDNEIDTRHLALAAFALLREASIDEVRAGCTDLAANEATSRL